MYIVNVLHIEVTTMYDGASDAFAALDLMKATYSNSTWHYADPVTGEERIQVSALFRKSYGVFKVFFWKLNKPLTFVLCCAFLRSPSFHVVQKRNCRGCIRWGDL